MSSHSSIRPAGLRALSMGLCSLCALGCLSAPMARAAEPTAAVSAPARSEKPLPTAPGDYKTTAWKALVPKDWDPSQAFKGLNLLSLKDGDTKANTALERMRQVWDAAPAEPGMEGADIRIPGYVVPLEGDEKGLREFLLVPYFGACIHSPPPPANQIIHVTLSKPAVGVKSMDAIWVFGRLHLASSSTDMGKSGYHMDAQMTTAYQSTR